MNKSDKNKIAVLIVFVVLVAITVFVFYYLRVTRQEPESVPAAGETQSPPSDEAPATAEQPGEEVRPAKPAMAKPTDAQIREWAEALSEDEEFIPWIRTRHLLGKFVALVENISTGQSPRKLLGFMEPEGRFEVIERGEQEFLDPTSYRRYDPVVKVFTSLDAHRCARMFRKMYPWLNRKYRELGEPGLDFRGALTRAIADLLRVPMVQGEIPLKRKAVTLKIAIKELEAMSDAQKHLFRMGPDNIRKVQTKLRELGHALGLSEDLDSIQPLTYTYIPSE